MRAEHAEHGADASRYEDAEHVDSSLPNDLVVR